jgi:heme oxygenase
MDRLRLERYLRDEALRAALERAARRERAAYVHRLLARAGQALFGTRRAAARAPGLRAAGCG